MRVEDHPDIDLLITLIGHDLRGPLNVLTLVSDVLERSDSAPSPEMIARLRRSTDRMDRRIVEITEFARARFGGGIALARRPVQSTALMGAVARRVARSYPEIGSVPARVESCTADIDPDRAERAIFALVANALDRGGEPSIEGRAAEGGLEITVRDKGAPLANLDALHEPDRTCLELFLAAETARAHGGDASGHSTSSGTALTLRFPGPQKL